MLALDNESAFLLLKDLGENKIYVEHMDPRVQDKWKDKIELWTLPWAKLCQEIKAVWVIMPPVALLHSWCIHTGMG